MSPTELGAKKKAAKEKNPKPPKVKKAAPPHHPSYFQMVKEAITTVKDKGGLSPYAIAKYMEEKYKNALPPNYKKILTVQLRNCVSRGKLVRVKGSFKLSEASKKLVVKKKLVTKKAGANKVPTKKVGPKKVAAKETRKRKQPSSKVPQKKTPKGSKKVKRSS